MYEYPRLRISCFARRLIVWVIAASSGNADALNKRSRSAALRLGFTYEGLFRQHMIVKDRNRDTTWFSMLDTEWSRIKKKYGAMAVPQSG